MFQTQLREPRLVMIKVHKAQDLVLNIADNKKKKAGSKWRVVFVGGSKKKATELVEEASGNPEWNCEVTLKVTSRHEPLSLLVVDSDNHHVGQVVLPLSRLPPYPLDGDPTAPWRLQTDYLEPTKKMDRPEGRLFYWAWIQEYQDEHNEGAMDERKASSGSLTAMSVLSRSRQDFKNFFHKALPSGEKESSESGKKQDMTISTPNLAAGTPEKKKKGFSKKLKARFSVSGSKTASDSPANHVQEGDLHGYDISIDGSDDTFSEASGSFLSSNLGHPRHHRMGSSSQSDLVMPSHRGHSPASSHRALSWVLASDMSKRGPPMQICDPRNLSESESRSREPSIASSGWKPDDKLRTYSGVEYEEADIGGEDEEFFAKIRSASDYFSPPPPPPHQRLHHQSLPAPPLPPHGKHPALHQTLSVVPEVPRRSSPDPYLYDELNSLPCIEIPLSLTPPRKPPLKPKMTAPPRPDTLPVTPADSRTFTETLDFNKTPTGPLRISPVSTNPFDNTPIENTQFAKMAIETANFATTPLKTSNPSKNSIFTSSFDDSTLDKTPAIASNISGSTLNKTPAIVSNISGSTLDKTPAIASNISGSTHDKTPAIATNISGSTLVTTNSSWDLPEVRVSPCRPPPPPPRAKTPGDPDVLKLRAFSSPPNVDSPPPPSLPAPSLSWKSAESPTPSARQTSPVPLRPSYPPPTPKSIMKHESRGATPSPDHQSSALSSQSSSLERSSVAQNGTSMLSVPKSKKSTIGKKEIQEETERLRKENQELHSRVSENQSRIATLLNHLANQKTEIRSHEEEIERLAQSLCRLQSQLLEDGLFQYLQH